MDRTELLLKELSEAFGPSGFEGLVRSIVRRELSPLTEDIETDGVGSLIARLPGEHEKPRVLLSAHMDEVGLMVKYVTDEGYVKFQQLGGWLDQALVGQRWRIVTRGDEVPGVTGVKTIHVMNAEERKKTAKSDEMFIDVDASGREDAEERLGIRPGDPIAPDSRFAPLERGRLYVGKAWDDRAGVAAMIEVVRSLRKSAAPNTVYAVATAQEEIGLRGARTSSYRVEPDVGINLEAGVAGDYPGITRDEAQERLGAGPTVFLHDSMMLPNLRLRDLVAEVADTMKMQVQFNVLKGYGEDGAEVQRSHGGAPTINVAIPTRYLHSHNGVISRDDFDRTVKLLAEVVRRLDAATVRELRAFD